MNDIALEFDHVWKKFKKGEKYDSLRDLIPAMTKRLFTKNNRGELQEKEFWAVKDVSFEVKRGEALGIIGPNGAGKSTILKLLSGILRPNKGQIKVNGRLSALIEVGAGFHQDLTGRENIYLNGAILGMKKDEVDKKLDEIIGFSGISEFIDTPVKRYSSGMYARLGFSVAAHIEPDILLVDEVLSVGDMEFQQKCIEKMLSLRNRDVTIIFISHNLQSVQLLCKNTFLLRNGQIITSGKTSEAITEYLTTAQKQSSENIGSTQVRHVTLLNKEGKQDTRFKAGDKAFLKFNISLDKPFGEYVLGFLVHRAEDGFLACDYNLPLFPLESDYKGENKERALLLSFQANLLRGLYTVTLHIHHNPTGRHVYWGRNLVFFTVDENVSYAGVSYLDPYIIPEA